MTEKKQETKEIEATPANVVRLVHEIEDLRRQLEAANEEIARLRRLADGIGEVAKALAKVSTP